MKNLDVRWRQRFDNYRKAIFLLSDALKDGADKLSLLEKEGMLQRFEFTFELAWKVMKDYLENGGVIIDPLTPKNVIKQAFAAKIIDDGQLWIDILLSRNLMSHTYDFTKFEAISKDVEKKYLPVMRQLEQYFLIKND